MALGLLGPTGSAAVRARLAAAGAPAGPPVAAALRERLPRFDLGDEALYLAWEVARCATGLAPDEAGALLVLVTATLVAQQRGSTRLPLDDAAGALCAELGTPDAWPVARALLDDPRLAAVVGGPDDYTPLVVERGGLYHQRLRCFEERLARALRPRLAAAGMPGAPTASAAPDAPAAPVAAALADVLARPARLGAEAVTLSPEQQAAVARAVATPLTIVTGGPGTGKTAIVVSILRVLGRLGVAPEEVALAAPTGKAARRLQESIGGSLATIAAPADADRALAGAVDPVTLHRLLGASRAGDRFRHHEHNRLAARAVVVDECSMVDLVLMERLTRALRDDARLVLLGDAAQLPSVAAGAVFRDLAAAGAAATVRLTHSYRMDAADPAGRAILEVAGRIDAGRIEELPPAAAAPLAVRAALADLAFAGVELVPPDAVGLRAFLGGWFERRVAALPGFRDLVRRGYPLGPSGFAPADVDRLEALFAHYDGQRLLCVTRGAERETGAAAVNARLHDLLAAATGAADDGARRAELLAGAPVMMQRNDYERGLVNGDQGLVLWVRPPGAGADHPPMAVFRRGRGDYGVFALHALRAELEPSFAVTVHKGQGSEFDHVGVILPAEPLPLLTREILYTAVSRSRRGVVIHGAPEVLRAGVMRRAERSTGVAERLAEPTG